MPKKINFIFYYLIYLLLGFFASTFIYTQYLLCINFVVGSSVKISFELIIFAFFKSFPVVLLFISLILLIHKIRHLDAPIFSIISYICMCAFTWFVLYPGLSKLQEKVFSELQIEDFTEVDTELSGGYFRKYDTKIYYFIDDSVDSKAHILFMHDSKNPEILGNEQIIDIGKSSEVFNSSKPFRETYFKNILRNYPYKITKVISKILYNAQKSLNKGFIAWFCFCSFAFALSSLYSFIKVSSWRMINLIWISFISFFIILFNYFYDSAILLNIKNVFDKLIYGSEITRFKYFYENDIDLSLCFINLFFGIVIIIVGSIVTSVRKKNKTY